MKAAIEAPTAIQEFHYTLAGRVASATPGAHAGRFDGDGTLLRAHVPLGQGADPRRIDLRASLRDPFGTLLVRRFRQPGNLLVATLVDVSASMRRLTSAHAAIDEAARFVASAGYSAHRSGDRFACYAAADAPFEAASQPPAQGKALGVRAAEALRSARPTGAGASGLPALVQRLPLRRALLFVVSDFLWPKALLDSLLAATTAHALVPVALHDPHALDALPRRGAVRVADAETGAQRTLWMRPALRARLADAERARREQLDAHFDAAGRRVMWLPRGFTTDDVSRYFVG